jgi:hypothetical protein
MVRKSESQQRISWETRFFALELVRLRLSVKRLDEAGGSD